MLKIKQNQWFDINNIGILIVLLMMLIFLFQELRFFQLFIFELVLLICFIYLYQRIKANKNSAFLINSENCWFIETMDERYPVSIKDYWIHTGRLFIWLKGSNKSVSFFVSRSTIGADIFSQLRTKLI